MQAEIDEPEPYSESRYLAAISVLDYQGSSTIDDINWHAQTQVSLEEEIEVLEQRFGVVKENDERYSIRSWFEDEAEAIGELVQVDYGGEWRDIELSDEEKDEVANNGAEIVYWLT